ncbi:MAG: TRAP transporter substrate-binding protein [Geminicoccaceae bacterium]
MRRRRLGLGLAMVLGAAAFTTHGSVAQEAVIRARGPSDLHAAATAVGRLADGIAQASQGRVEITVEPDAADTAAVIADLQNGAVELGWVRVADIADLVPEVAALSVPFLFRDPAKAVAILDAASLGPLLGDQLRKQGLEPLGYLNVGALRLAGSGPPSIPDLAGQQVAGRTGQLRAVAFQALGAELVPGGADTKGLVELRSDDLGAAGTTLPLVLAEAPHAYDIVVLCAGRDRFREFAPDVQEMLQAQAQQAAVWQRGATTQADAAGLDALKRQGAQVVRLPDEDLRDAHAKVKAAMTEALRGAEPSIVRTVLAYAD